MDYVILVLIGCTIAFSVLGSITVACILWRRRQPFTLHIRSSRNGLVVRDEALKEGWDGKKPLRVVIYSNATIYPIGPGQTCIRSEPGIEIRNHGTIEPMGPQRNPGYMI